MTVTPEQIAAEASRGGVYVFYCNYVMKLHDRGGKDQRILIISNLSISFCKIKSHASFDREMFWPNITSLNIDQNTVTLIFGQDQFRFETEEITEIIDVIIPILQHVLTKSEYDSLNLKFPYENFEYSNPIGFLSRFSSLMKKSGLKMGNDLGEIYKYTAKFKPNTIEIPASCSKLTNLNPILYSLDLAPFVESLVLPHFSNLDVFRLTKDYLAIAPHLRHVLFANANTRSFVEFCQTLINSQNLHLTGLSFKSTPLKKEHLIKLKELMVSKKLLSVSLQNSIDKSAMDYLYNNFFDEKMDHIQMLNFDRTSNIKFNLLIPQITNISYLSFTSCKIDIYQFFKAVNKVSMPNLKMLNLSINECHNPVSSTMAFPPNLIRLNINVIKWDQGCIQPFMQAVTNFDWKPGFTLGFADEITNDADWSELFNIMETSGLNNISHLVWSYNRVSPAFFNFLGKNCINLQSLIMVGCLSASMHDEIDAFINALKVMPLLTKLVITGRDNALLGKEVCKILDGLLVRKTIRILDISSNQIGDDGLLYLAEFIKKCPSITDVGFDNSGTTSIGPISNIIEAVANRPSPLYISWPMNDFSSLISSEKVKSDELYLINELFINISKEDNFQNPNQPFFAQPFESHIIDPHIRYPLFISSEMELLENVSETNVNEVNDDDYISSGFIQQVENDSSSPFISSHGKKNTSSGFDLWADTSSDGGAFCPNLQIQVKKSVPPTALDHFDDDDDDDSLLQLQRASPKKVGFDLKNTLDAFAESSDPNISSKDSSSKPRSKSLPVPKLALDAFAESSDTGKPSSNSDGKGGLAAFAESDSSPGGGFGGLPANTLKLQANIGRSPTAVEFSLTNNEPLAISMKPPLPPPKSLDRRSQSNVSEMKMQKLALFIESSDECFKKGSSNDVIDSSSSSVLHASSPEVAMASTEESLDSSSPYKKKEIDSTGSSSSKAITLMKSKRLFFHARSQEYIPFSARTKIPRKSKNEKLTLEQFMEAPKVIKQAHLPLDVFADYPESDFSTKNYADDIIHSDYVLHPKQRLSIGSDFGAMISLDKYHSVNSVGDDKSDDDDYPKTPKKPMRPPKFIRASAKTALTPPIARFPHRKTHQKQHASADLSGMTIHKTQRDGSPGAEAARLSSVSTAFENSDSDAEDIPTMEASATSTGSVVLRVGDETSGQYSGTSGREERVPADRIDAYKAEVPRLASLAGTAADTEDDVSDTYDEVTPEANSEKPNIAVAKTPFTVFPNFGQNARVYQPPPSWLGEDLLGSDSNSISESQSQSQSQSLSQSIPIVKKPMYGLASSSSVDMDITESVERPSSTKPAVKINASIPPIMEEENERNLLESLRDSDLSSVAQVQFEMTDSVNESEVSQHEEEKTRKKSKIPRRMKAPGSLSALAGRMLDERCMSDYSERRPRKAPRSLRADRSTESLRECYSPPDWTFPLNTITRPHSNKYVAAIQSKFTFDFLISSLRK